jgi:GNAT superfamily N-acetyltransferase
MEWRQGDYRISDETARVDLDVVHGYLTTSYWSEGIPREIVKRSVENALCFSLWWEPGAGSGAAAPGEVGTSSTPRQIGFARVITDRATFAYLGDVFVLEEFRGRGFSKWLMQVVIDHPDLQGLRRWVLLTRDAHGLYEKVGFTKIARPERYMERWTPELYKRGTAPPGARS